MYFDRNNSDANSFWSLSTISPNPFSKVLHHPSRKSYSSTKHSDLQGNQRQKGCISQENRLPQSSIRCSSLAGILKKGGTAQVWGDGPQWAGVQTTWCAALHPRGVNTSSSNSTGITSRISTKESCKSHWILGSPKLWLPTWYLEVSLSRCNLPIELFLP